MRRRVRTTPRLTLGERVVHRLQLILQQSGRDTASTATTAAVFDEIAVGCRPVADGLVQRGAPSAYCWISSTFSGVMSTLASSGVEGFVAQVLGSSFKC